MGREFGIGLVITDKELYIRLNRSSFNVYDEKGKVTDKYIDYAHFFGIRDIKYGDEGDEKLTAEETSKLVELTKYRPIRCGHIHIGKWNKKEGKAWVCFIGWNSVPFGVAEYISKLYPNKELQFDESWDDEEFDDSPHSCTYFLKNGRMNRQISEEWGGRNDEGCGIWNEVEFIFDEEGNQIDAKIISSREVEPEDSWLWDNL